MLTSQVVRILMARMATKAILTNNTDNDDNGVAGAGTFLGAVVSDTITLYPFEPSSEPDPTPSTIENPLPDNLTNETLDFGFYRNSLGNEIFVDANNDGLKNGSEAALTSTPITVRLYDGAGNEVPVGPDGVLGTPDDGPGGVVDEYRILQFPGSSRRGV